MMALNEYVSRRKRGKRRKGTERVKELYIKSVSNRKRQRKSYKRKEKWGKKVGEKKMG